MVSEATKKGHTRLSPLCALERLTSRQSLQVFDKPKMDPAKGLERVPTPLQDSDFLQGHLAMPLPMLRGISKARQPGVSLSPMPVFLSDLRGSRCHWPHVPGPWQGLERNPDASPDNWALHREQLPWRVVQEKLCTFLCSLVLNCTRVGHH